MEKKTAVVTGASSGIGYAICTTLLGEGYNVVANGRTIRSAFDETECLMTNSENMLISETAQHLLDAVLTKWGSCDVLCVNAGIIESNPIECINIDAMCEMVRLKVEMSFRLIYTFLKYFK